MNQCAFAEQAVRGRRRVQLPCDEDDLKIAFAIVNDSMHELKIGRQAVFLALSQSFSGQFDTENIVEPAGPVCLRDRGRKDDKVLGGEHETQSIEHFLIDTALRSPLLCKAQDLFLLLGIDSTCFKACELLDLFVGQSGLATVELMVVTTDMTVGELGDLEIREFADLRTQVAADRLGHRDGSAKHFRRMRERAIHIGHLSKLRL